MTLVLQAGPGHAQRDARNRKGRAMSEASPPDRSAGLPNGAAADRSVPEPDQSIEYRAAYFSDSLDIARFICVAGGGLYEFLFDDIVPFMTATEFLAAGVAGEDAPISHRNCHVAVDRADGRMLGAANAFPADLLRAETYPLLPRERHEHIRPMLELQDWGSMFLNALAVDEACRGRGIGNRLLGWAATRAQDLGFDRLSLHVWTDNTGARDFYKARGFVELGLAQVGPHPRLAHKGGSVLMSLKLPRHRGMA
jgi:ribosomal protein S18 acetylase RimI-like enzyme